MRKTEVTVNFSRRVCMNLVSRSLKDSSIRNTKDSMEGARYGEFWDQPNMS